MNRNPHKIPPAVSLRVAQRHLCVSQLPLLFFCVFSVSSKWSLEWKVRQAVWGQTCAPLNGQNLMRGSGATDWLTARSWSCLPGCCHFDRVPHGHGLGLRASGFPYLPLRPADKSQFDCLYVSLTGHGGCI